MKEKEVYEVFRREAYLLAVFVAIFGIGLTFSTIFSNHYGALLFGGLLMWVSGLAFGFRYTVRKLIKKVNV